MNRLNPAILILTLLISGCAAWKATTVTHPGTQDTLANNAYDVVAGAKGYLDSERKQHPECATVPASDVCTRISQAVGAKDLIIDALSVYCGGPNFSNGGACDPPAKGTPAATQATAKLQSAISGYNIIAADLKKATGGH